MSERGDRRARLEALWDAHHRRVHAYALRRTDAASAQDVLSETFVVAWRRVDEIPREPLPWLLGVARRVLANQRRGDRRQAELASAMRPLAHDRGGDPAGRDRGVLEALAALPGADRELLLLVAWDGLRGAEAAAVVGCTPATAWVRLHRARRRLAALLDAPAGAGAPAATMEEAHGR